MSLINSPGTDPVDRVVNGVAIEVNQGWRNFFNAAYTLLYALTQSGTTAQRPTKFLWVGRTYFDVTVATPVWWNGSDWIQADGTVV